ncbi:MAG: hypothetical protein BroJett025_09580 [Patescibacteria group bacterium]|nr:MAG: hypothetical protein BroJett025_09580 [Patescibacteria group bacterium]
MTITKILTHPITIVSITIIATMFFFSLDKSGKKTQNSSENIRVLEHEVNQVSQEIIELEKKIEQTQSEQFKEKVVRNELLLQKPGEYVLQISEIKESGQSQDCASLDCKTESNSKKESPASAWIELLF